MLSLFFWKNQEHFQRITDHVLPLRNSPCGLLSETVERDLSLEHFLTFFFGHYVQKRLLEIDKKMSIGLGHVVSGFNICAFLLLIQSDPNSFFCLSVPSGSCFIIN